jgi:hypothetical protein
MSWATRDRRMIAKEFRDGVVTAIHVVRCPALLGKDGYRSTVSLEAFRNREAGRLTDGIDKRRIDASLVFHQPSNRLPRRRQMAPTQPTRIWFLRVQGCPGDSSRERVGVLQRHRLGMEKEAVGWVIPMSQDFREIEALIERLKSNARLPLCPYDRRSPDYWTIDDVSPCKVCGTRNEPGAPDLCRGADTGLFTEAADALSVALLALKASEVRGVEMTKLHAKLHDLLHVAFMVIDDDELPGAAIVKLDAILQKHFPEAYAEG